MQCTRMSMQASTSARPAAAPRAVAFAGARAWAPLPRRCVALRAAPAEEEKAAATPAKEAEDELPPWVRNEQMRAAKEKSGDLPFGLYLLAASIVTIAAVGSVFEFFNKNAIFGVVQPDSPLYTPILGVFALTGIPTAGYLFLKSVDAANKLAEAMDEADGYN